MPTVLRASGPYELLRHTMQSAPFDFRESVASRKRRERGEASADGWCTFNFTVSDADGDKVPIQIKECESFLSANGDAIEKLTGSEGVEILALDFSWDMPQNSCGQFNTFPTSLLRICENLGIEIKVSVYPSRADETDNESGGA